MKMNVFLCLILWVMASQVWAHEYRIEPNAQVAARIGEVFPKDAISFHYLGEMIPLEAEGQPNRKRIVLAIFWEDGETKILFGTDHHHFKKKTVEIRFERNRWPENWY